MFPQFITYTFTSRAAPGIQICSGRGSAGTLQSIARPTTSRICVNHQLARAIRPCGGAAEIFRPASPSSSCLFVALIVFIMRTILPERVGQMVSKPKNRFGIFSANRALLLRKRKINRTPIKQEAIQPIVPPHPPSSHFTVDTTMRHPLYFAHG